MHAGLILVAALVSVPGAGVKDACQLLTIEEVAKAANAGPLAIDPQTSGETDNGGSSCTWQPKGQAPAVILTVENGARPGGTAAARFAASKIETFGGGRTQPAAVPGLGDEALYRDFDNGKGGALLVRRGNDIVTFSGSARRDVYVALARLVLQRL